MAVFLSWCGTINLAGRCGLRGKRVLITGASRGIGESLAYAFAGAGAGAGATVALVARTEDSIRALAAERGGTAHPADLADAKHGNVLDILVQSPRNAKAAKRFLRKLLTGLQYVPRVIVSDKLASYRVAHRELVSSVTHRRSKYLNNRAENSHQPTRIREPGGLGGS